MARPDLPLIGSGSIVSAFGEEDDKYLILHASEDFCGEVNMVGFLTRICFISCLQSVNQ